MFVCTRVSATSCISCRDVLHYRGKDCTVQYYYSYTYAYLNFLRNFVILYLLLRKLYKSYINSFLIHVPLSQSVKMMTMIRLLCGPSNNYISQATLKILMIMMMMKLYDFITGLIRVEKPYGWEWDACRAPGGKADDMIDIACRLTD